MIKIRRYIANKLNSFLNNESGDKIEIYLKKYLKSDKNIVLIDVGAHRGDFIELIRKHYNIHKAILIEPIAELSALLKDRYINSNIFIYQNALTDKNLESVDFKIYEYQETSSILEFRSEMKELVNVNTKLERIEPIITRTLDSISEEIGLKLVDLIKIDVQGAEHLVISGAKNVLACTKYIWIELSFKPLYINSSVFQNIYSLMEENGFILLELSPGHRSPIGELLQADALFANLKLL